jgi:outer membrane protein OmpA-like peptidoglycan-associated protein
MKKIIASCLAIAFLWSCDAVKNANNTQKGAVIGAAAGTIIGGVLGNNVGKGGNGTAGAVLGGVIGGMAGAAIGNKMDKQAREIENALPSAEVERVGEGIKLVLGENAVRFETSKSTLTPQARENLDKLVPVFVEYPDTDIMIFGYTDSTGRLEFNQKLSEDRAASVRAYLISKGLAASRFKTTGMGPQDPIATNDTPEGRAKNRRVEFAITANQKMIDESQKQN